MASLLPADSRILAFQQGFELLSQDPEPMDVLEWVFRLTEEQQKATPLERLPEETSLQRSMKAFLLHGGKVGTARGRLVRPFSR